jgi:hypothetical protein
MVWQKRNEFFFSRDGKTALVQIRSRVHGTHYALIDAADADLVSQRCVCLKYSPERAEGRRMSVKTRAVIDGEWRYVYLHQLLLGGSSPDRPIDHINGDPLDNRRANLRTVTHQQNQWNRVSGKGHGWDEEHKAWRARIHVDGKRIHLGYFKDRDEAAAAYAAAKQVHHAIT